MEALARRAGSALAKALLLVTSLLVVFCAVEFAVLPRLLLNPPHKYQSRFPQIMQVISQHSKRGLMPRDYLLLVGDSYAQGYGEWLDRADPEGNDPYHSAHVLHERLDRDVLSYGKSGAGSIPGLVLMPARLDRALARYDLERPRTVAVYFYDGNDLNDNRRYLQRHFPGGPGSRELLDDAAFDAFLTAERDAYLRRHAAVDATLTAPFVVVASRRAIKRWWRSLRRAQDIPAATRDEPITQARVGGEVVALPRRLQSPALELSREELFGALQVTRRSLAHLAARYPDAELLLFRIPSPLSSYEIVSDRVHIQSYEDREPVRSAERLERYSRTIGHALKDFAAELGYRYVDLRPVLQEAAREHVLHGPEDWKHLNQAGYTVLGEAVARELAAGPPPAAALSR